MKFEHYMYVPANLPNENNMDRLFFTNGHFNNAYILLHVGKNKYW